jgi:CP family cyanate transporter-like MFS transporter
MKFNFNKINVLIDIILSTLNLRAAVTSLSGIFSAVDQHIQGFNISVIGMLPLLSFAIFGLITPKISKKIGYECTLLISMMCVGLGLLSRVFMPTFIGFCISSIVSLSGMAFGNVLMPTMIKKYFGNHTGAITSLYSVLLAISAGIPSIISSNTVYSFGWQFSLGIWSLIGFLAAIPWLFQLFHLRNYDSTGTEARINKSNSISNRSISSINSKITWAVALLFGVGGMLPMYTVINWLPSYLKSVGFETTTIGTILFLYNTLGIFHSFLVPLFLDKMKHPYILVIFAVFLQISTFLGFWFIPRLSLLWAIIAAPGLLTVPAAFQLFNMHSRTPEGTASISSMAQFIGYLLAALGPLIFGWLKRISGVYSYSFLFLITLSILTLFFGYIAMKPGYIEDN